MFSCTAPSGGGFSVNLTNDLAVAVAGISTKTTPGVNSCVDYSIDKLTFTTSAQFDGDASSDSTEVPSVNVVNTSGVNSITSDGANVRLGGDFSVKDLNIANTGSCNNIGNIKATGNVVVGKNSAYSLFYGPTASVTVKNGGQLGILGLSSQNYSNKITFEGGSSMGWGIGCSGAGGGGASSTIKLTGDILLNGNVTYKFDSTHTVEVTGKLDGLGKFVAHPENKGTLVIASSNNTSGSANGEQGNVHETETINLDDDKDSEDLIVEKNKTVILNGKRAYATVNEGGILKGDATVRSLTVGGIVAPGNSPGKITVLESFYLNNTGVYQLEILNSESYDQIEAQSVGLSGKLDISYLEGGKINKGDTFVIINNTGTAPVQGTFEGLEEGAEISVGGAVFTISYKGGNGNDVVLVAQNDSVGPIAPNTGAQQLISSPAAAVAAAVSAAAMLVIASKKKVFGKR